MTRPQWLLVGFIGLIAALAYIKADTLTRRLTATGYPRNAASWLSDGMINLDRNASKKSDVVCMTPSQGSLGSASIGTPRMQL